MVPRTGSGDRESFLSDSCLIAVLIIPTMANFMCAEESSYSHFLLVYRTEVMKKAAECYAALRKSCRFILLHVLVYALVTLPSSKSAEPVCL